jgi:hypothetical protein
MTTIKDIWVAMSKGKEIINPATWKDRQRTTSIVVALLGVSFLGLRFSGVELPVSDEDVAQISAGIAAILGATNHVVTTISSKKVGSEPKENEQ